MERQPSGESSGSRAEKAGGAERSEKAGGADMPDAGGKSRAESSSGADGKSKSGAAAAGEGKTGADPMDRKERASTGSEMRGEKGRSDSSADGRMHDGTEGRTRETSEERTRDTTRERAERGSDGGVRGERSTNTVERGESRERGSSRTSVNVSTEQRTTIRNTIVSSGSVRKVPRSSLRDVNISVGVSVPRTVTIERLPPKIVQLVPEYSEYSYFVTEEDEIAIVDPDTYEIVYVISS